MPQISRQSLHVRQFAAIALAFACLQLTAGCASRPQPSNATPTVDPAEAATLNVYRAKEFPAGAALRFYVYVDGTRFGQVSSGKGAFVLINPGKHQLSIQGELMGVATGKPTVLDFEAKPKTEYFARFSLSINNLQVYGTAASANSTRSLELVDHDAWAQQK